MEKRPKMSSLAFVGDLMFGDQPITLGYGFDSIHSSNGYGGIFNNVSSNLKQADVVIGNFESVIRPRPEQQTVKNWAMCCDAVVAERLYEANIRIVSLANNHTMDYGPEAYQSTKKALLDAGINIIGDNVQPWFVIKHGREKVGLVAASYIKTSAADICYLYEPDEEKWQEIIHEMRIAGAEKIVAYLHWGNEFISIPNQKQVDVAIMLEKMGFDLALGSHAHILQPGSMVKEMPVIFGLGNFISDYWQQRLRETMIVKVSWDKEIILLSQERCINDQYGQPSFIREEKTQLKDKTGIATNDEISHERWRVRKEYLIKLIKNIHKLKNKSAMFLWLIQRFIYLIRFGRRELKNPDILYEKYKG